MIFSEHNKQRNNISMYFRYVDDTFLLFDGSLRELDMPHKCKYLNNLVAKLKFTINIQKEDKLNFLDLTITKES